MFERIAESIADIGLHDQAAILRVTLDNMDQGLIMTDSHGRVAVCNKRAIVLLNLPSALMASRPRVDEVIAYQVRHGELEGLPRDLTAATIEEQVRPNGVVIERRCVPLPEGGVVCTYTDVTERRESAELLRIARDTAEIARQEAEAASGAKTDFLAAMSHEIRTPLNAIIGFSDLIAESGRLQSDLQRHADVIRASGHALLTVVNDILDFSKVEAGKIVLTQTPFSPRALTENCIAIVRGTAIDKSLSIDLHLDATLPEGLVGDEARLRQVLLNLLNNAVKFTRQGSVTLTVARDGAEGAADTFLFSVKDTGIGIARDMQDRLFQTFSQVDSSIGREFGGTGLGLAICRRLVELMGGRIGVRSEAGEGAEFWFNVTLPAAEECSLAPEKALIQTKSRPGRLLLVEDVEGNQKLARLVLEAVGHSVEIVADGESAIAAVRDRPLYDLVLMDVQMQGMDGLAATRHIRGLPGRRGSIPIVAMTANVLPEQVRQFMDAGMNDCVGKPFKRAELYATIDRWLRDGREDVTDDDPARAADAPVDAFDEATFDQLVDLMGPLAVSGLMGKFAADLDRCLALMKDRPRARADIRRQVHDLVSALGMIGLSGLTKAFADVLAYDEARIRAEGEPDYIGVLRRAISLGTPAAIMIRTLADDLRGREGGAPRARSARS